MTDCLGANKVLKSLFKTRWSTHSDAPIALRNGYNHFSEALRSFVRKAGRNKKMGKFESIKSSYATDLTLYL